MHFLKGLLWGCDFTSKQPFAMEVGLVLENYIQREPMQASKPVVHVYYEKHVYRKHKAEIRQIPRNIGKLSFE